MAKMDHPTIKWFKENSDIQSGNMDLVDMDYKKLKEIAREVGADDCGIADICSADLEDEKEDILALYPKTKALISIVISLNPENVRCVSRAVSDLEFMQGFERSNKVAKKLAAVLKTYGINVLHPSAGFPMNVSQWPGKMWSVSHKPLRLLQGWDT